MSSATAIGVFGNQLGVALGFVIPAAVVNDQLLPSDYHLIGTSLTQNRHYIKLHT